MFYPIHAHRGQSIPIACTPTRLDIFVIYDQKNPIARDGPTVTVTTKKPRP